MKSFPIVKKVYGTGVKFIGHNTMTPGLETGRKMGGSTCSVLWTKVVNKSLDSEGIQSIGIGS